MTHFSICVYQALAQMSKEPEWLSEGKVVQDALLGYVEQVLI